MQEMLATSAVASVLAAAAGAAFVVVVTVLVAVVASGVQTAVALTKVLLAGYWQNFVAVYFAVVAAGLTILVYVPSYLSSHQHSFSSRP